MLRITDQYFWNFVFGIFFVSLFVMGAIILETEARLTYAELTLLDLALVTLAVWRLVHLFVYEHTTKWFREQFYDVKKVGKGYVLEKPKFGPRRAVADILTSPWSMGTILAGLVVFAYLMTSYAFYLVLLLAIAGVASLLQIFSNQLGWQGEKLRQEVDGE